MHAERWVREASVLPYVAAMVSHAGAGSVRTALSAGVPLALAPRFGDQPLNARAVEAAGAGLVVADGRPDRREPSARCSPSPPTRAWRPGSRPRSTALPEAGEAIEVLRESAAVATT